MKIYLWFIFVICVIASIVSFLQLAKGDYPIVKEYSSKRSEKDAITLLIATTIALWTFHLI